MEDLFAALNPAQREAVATTEGYIRVIAGAGSGKTRALVHRYCYLVQEMGILPENILCVTFTNKAAGEMRRRIRRLSVDSDTAYIGTFHSFCVSVLQEDIHALGYPKSFVVLDNSDIDSMLKLIYEERGLTMRHMTFSAARDMIEMQKTLYEPEYYKPMLALSVGELRQKYMDAQSPKDIIFWGYVYQEKKCFALDYNDLILLTLHIFREQEDVRRKWQERLAYIMVDEYQDIDPLQYRLLQELCPLHGNLFIVGDPDQTIYTWRGASVKFILNFDKEFPDVKTIFMQENYRSTPEIVAAANSLISRNTARIKKDLASMRDAGAKPVYHHARTSEEEAAWIAEEILRLRKAGASLGKIAVLYRAHYLSRTLEEAFLKREIPYTVYSGAQFFDRAEIKDALSYLRMVCYKDDLAFRRIANTPRRNLGEKRMRYLADYAEKNACTLYDALRRSAEEELFHTTKAQKFISLIEDFSDRARTMALSELFPLLMDESGYEAMLRLEGSQARLDNLAELKQAVESYVLTCGEECSAEDYLARAALMTAADQPDGRDAVRFMTVHTAKGLEFPTVFLCGMDEGIFPSKKTADAAGMEEERRLAFVAVTRAEDRLYFSDAEGRNLDGSYRYPSRFVLEIEKNLVTYTTELPEALAADALAYRDASERQLAACAGSLNFREGDRVRHSVLGAGTVERLERAKGAYVIRFDGYPATRNISFRAKLEKI